eukprot:5234531-Pleurochrysis_carterae.AAC.1
MVGVRRGNCERSSEACLRTLALEERVRHRDTSGERVGEGRLEKGLRRAGADHPALLVRVRRMSMHSQRHVRAEIKGCERGRKIARRAHEHGE